MSAPDAELVAAQVRDDLAKLFAAIEAGACCARIGEHVLVAGEAEYHPDRRIVRCCACGAEYPAYGEPEGVQHGDS